MTLQEIRNLPPATVNTIVQSDGQNTAGLAPEQVQFLLQLNRAACLMNDPESDGSQLAIARRLQQEFPQISLRTARRRVADAISYLYHEEENTPEEWHQFYADKMDALGRKAEQAGDNQTALRCYAQAHEYREKAAAARVNPELTQFRQILVSPDTMNQRMGLDQTGMRELMQRATELITRSNLPDREKQRLIEEAEMELIV